MGFPSMTDWSMTMPSEWGMTMPGEMQMGPFSCDMTENDREFMIMADLPGVQKKDIKIQLRDNSILHITARREREKIREGEAYSRRERSYGEFSREMTLPANVDGAKISTRFENGVLEVKMPKVMPKQMAVHDI